MNLYYEITEDGYYIKDKDSDLIIHQYEPYIPNKELSYEDNAKAQIEKLIKMKQNSGDKKASNEIYEKIKAFKLQQQNNN